MKHFKRFVCLILVASIIAATPVFAAEKLAATDENANARSSSYFGRSSVFLYQTASTTFEAWFDVSAVGMMDELGASVIKIQKSSDGVNWTTIRTFTKEAYPSMICENTSAHANGYTHIGISGYYYRAYITLYAKKGTGFGEVYEYTSVLKL